MRAIGASGAAPAPHPRPTRRSTALLRRPPGPAPLQPSRPSRPPHAGQAQPSGAQARQKWQRRITRGGKAARRAASQPPAPPTAGNNGAAAAAAAAEPAPAGAQQDAEAPNLDAWRDYLFPQQPALWAFALSFMPPPTLATMKALHPSVVFPAHYPDRLPPGLGLDLVPGAGPLPQLRPAAQPAAGAAAAAAAAGAAPQQQQQHAGPSWAGGGAAADASADVAAAASYSQLPPGEPFSEQPSSSSLVSDSSGGSLCMCEECCGGRSLSSGHSSGWGGYCSSGGCYTSGDGYCSTSPDDRMQPGKRIMWRGAIAHAGG